MANIELANKALGLIEKYPDYHYQGNWCEGGGEKFRAAADNGEYPEVCGTTLCMAGWVSFLAAPTGTVFESGSSWFELPDGEATNMEDYARRQLGLTRAQAHAMFISAHDLRDLKAVVGQLEADEESDEYAMRDALRASAAAKESETA